MRSGAQKGQWGGRQTRPARAGTGGGGYYTTPYIHAPPSIIQYSPTPSICQQCTQHGRICNGAAPCQQCLQYTHLPQLCSNLYQQTHHQLIYHHQTPFIVQQQYHTPPPPQQLLAHSHTRLNMQNIMEDIKQLRSVVSSLQNKIHEANQQFMHHQHTSQQHAMAAQSAAELSSAARSNSSDASDWDMYDPDFLMKQNDHLDLPVEVDVSLLAESVWSPMNMLADSLADDNTSLRPPSMPPVLNSHSKLPTKTTEDAIKKKILLDGYSEFELARLRHALDLLACFGVSLDHRPKIELYAQVVAHKSVIKTVNDEFCELVRGKRSDILGRALLDFTPRAFEQYHNFMFQRELLASGKSSVIFENVLARLDGTCFKCFNSIQVFYDMQGRLSETLLTIQLSTVTDLNLPPLPNGLPRTVPLMSPDMDYPDSPLSCHCDPSDKPSEEPVAKKARIRKD